MKQKIKTIVGLIAFAAMTIGIIIVTVQSVASQIP